MRETAKFFLACENMHRGAHEEALALFREVKSAYASFYAAEIYRKLAAEERLAAPTHLAASPAYINYLTDAREALYLTLDRLKAEPPGHTLNAEIGDAVEEVENLLHNTEPGEEGVASNGNGVDQPDSTLHRVSAQLSSTPRNRTLHARAAELAGTPAGARGGVYTPNRSLFQEEREAKPSPERLDAQIRQLNHSQVGWNLTFRNTGKWKI